MRMNVSKDFTWEEMKGLKKYVDGTWMTQIEQISVIRVLFTYLLIFGLLSPCRIFFQYFLIYGTIRSMGPFEITDT